MALSSIMTKSLLSANTAKQIAHVQHATKKEMDGHAGVLDAVNGQGISWTFSFRWNENSSETLKSHLCWRG